MTTKRPGSTPRRRWLSFSLRGMLILVTAACVWLAIVSTRARKQQQAVARIQEIRGIVYFDYEQDEFGRTIANGQPWAPQWLRNSVGEDYFRRVVTVDLSIGGRGIATDKHLAVFDQLRDVTGLELGRNPGITDEGLRHLAGLSRMRTLYLYRTGVTGPGLAHLPKSLELLSLIHTPLRDEGLIHVKRLSNLKFLDLHHTAITDVGLASLSDCVGIEEIRLRSTNISDTGLEHLRTLTNLKGLSLDRTNVTGRGVARLRQALPNCRISPDPRWLDATPRHIELWPAGYKPSTEEIVAKVKEVSNDAKLDVDQSAPGQPIVGLRLFDSTISDESLNGLLAEMPDLETLNLRHVLVGDRLAKQLPHLSRLRYLSLQDSKITDSGLAHVGKVNSLTELLLVDTSVSDAGLSHLAGLTNLDTIYIGETRVTDQGVANLRQALPKCEISGY